MSSASSSLPPPTVKGLYQILPYLYISDADVASSSDAKSVFKSLSISTIINASSEDVDNFFPDDFKYISLPIEDTHEGEPSTYFEQVYEVVSGIKESVGKGESNGVLIHCTTGKNISPTLVLAYMMSSSKKQDKHLPLAQALKYVQGKAPGAQPSDHFLSQLIELEEELFEESSIRVTKPRSAGAGKRGRGRGGSSGKGKRGK